MAQGAGKYDRLATYCREQVDAVGAVVIIVEGDQGSGFSVQTVEPGLQTVLPTLLETMAAQIREDNKRGRN